MSWLVYMERCLADNEFAKQIADNGQKVIKITRGQLKKLLIRSKRF